MIKKENSTKKIFFQIFLWVTVLCTSFQQNANALFGLSGAANKAMVNYRNLPSLDCILLEGIEKVANGPFPEEVKTACNIMVTSIIATVAAGSYFFGSGTLTALGILATLAAVAEGAQGSSQLCENPMHPGPIPDDQLLHLLYMQGKPHSSQDIVDHYDKICFMYHGKPEWLKRGDCTWIDGLQFCAIAEDWSDDFLCVYITSACPCVGTVAAGTLRTPVYEEGDSGTIKTDSKGNPTIKDESSFYRYFGKHCNFVTTDIETKLLPFEYTGIIDDICNSWRGYSKVRFPFTSGPIQCIQGTMQNIFEKPITFKNVDGIVDVSAENQAKLQAIQKDKALIIEIFNQAKSLAVQPNFSDSDFNIIVQRMTDAISGASMLSEFKQDYGFDKITFPAIPSGSTISAKRSHLNSTLPTLETMSKSIQTRIDSFLESLRATIANDGSSTTFQNLQSVVKIIAYFAIMLYLTITGLQVVLGGLDITMKEITRIGYQLALIYYFALGDAWKEYFYRMIFDASIGVSEVLFETLMDATSDPGTDCLFTKKYYTEEPGNRCIYENQNMQDTLAPFKVGTNKRTGADIYGCLKGPFIYEPNYTKPFLPTKYYEIDKYGVEMVRYVQVYCKNDAGNKVPAIKVLNDVTKEVKKWKCPIGYQMEEGYRINEYEKIGLGRVREYFPEKQATDIIETALIRENEDGRREDIFPRRAKSVEQAKIKVARFKDVEKLETLRSNVNQEKRYYPKIRKFGAIRDYAYVGLFDMMDCKVLKYIQYTGTTFEFLNVFDFMTFIVGGILIILVFFMMLVYIFYVAALMGRVVQSYIVGIVAITVLVYFSPIIMPLTLFSATKGIAKDWIEKIMGYAAYPAILFSSVGVAFAVMDFNMYGSPSLFKEKQMFKPDGKVDGKNCWEDDAWGAPLSCLLAKLPYKKKKITILFMSFTVSDVSSPFFLALLVSLLRSIMIVAMLQQIIQEYESSMQNLLNLNVDTGLEGSVFNTHGGLKDMAKSAASSVLGGVKRGLLKKGKKSGSGSSDEEGDPDVEKKSEKGPDTDGEKDEKEEGGEAKRASGATSESMPAKDELSSTTTTETLPAPRAEEATMGSSETATSSESSASFKTSTAEYKETAATMGSSETATSSESSASFKTSTAEYKETAATMGSSETATSSESSASFKTSTAEYKETAATVQGPTEQPPSSAGTRTEGTNLENDNYASSKGLSGDAIKALNEKKVGGSGPKRETKKIPQYKKPDYSNVKGKMDTQNTGYKPARPSVKRITSQRADYSGVKSRLYDYEKKGK